jgi:hypothetical protein
MLFAKDTTTIFLCARASKAFVQQRLEFHQFVKDRTGSLGQQLAQVIFPRSLGRVGCPSMIPEFHLDPTPRRLVAQLKAPFVVALRCFVVDVPAFGSKHHVHP